MKDESNQTLAKRDRLQVINGTHISDDSAGRVLKLTWLKDVHNPPQYSEISPGASDEKESKGIGRGHNTRTFEIHVERLKEGGWLPVGTFNHSIYNGPGSSGAKETVSIQVDYEEDHVKVYRVWYDAIPEEKRLETFGHASIDEW